MELSLFVIRYLLFPMRHRPCLVPSRVFVSLAILKDTIAAAGTALLLGAAAMSYSAGPRRGFRAILLRQRCSRRRLGGDRGAKRFAFEPARVEVTEASA